MNSKVLQWKRKLAKEERKKADCLRKEQEKMWDMLKYGPSGRYAGWSMADMMDINSTHGLDVEKELADILAKEIDKEILQGIIDGIKT